MFRSPHCVELLSEVIAHNVIIMSNYPTESFTRVIFAFRTPINCVWVALDVLHDQSHRQRIWCFREFDVFHEQIVIHDRGHNISRAEMWNWDT